MMRQRKRRKKPGNVANQPMRAMPESVLRLAREKVVGEKGSAPREGGAGRE